MRVGNSLAVQWLGLQASTAEGMVRPLVRELKSYMTQGHQKKKRKKRKWRFSCPILRLSLESARETIEPKIG